MQLSDPGGITVVDMEAGLELFGRSTPGPSDLVVAVAEPSLWSLQTAKRVVELARELSIPRVAAVANKVHDPTDEAWIREALEPLGVEVLAVVPYDPAVNFADRRLRAVIDVAAACPAVKAVEQLADRLEELEGTLAPGRPGSPSACG